MSKDKKRKRSSTNAVLLKSLAAKYNFTEQYVRQCVKGHSDSDKAAEIQQDYKKLEKELANLLTK